MYLVADDEPLSKLQICEAALQSTLFPDTPLPRFASDTGPVGKRCDDAVTRRMLNWTPLHSSFRAFMQARSKQ